MRTLGFKDVWWLFPAVLLILLESLLSNRFQNQDQELLYQQRINTLIHKKKADFERIKQDDSAMALIAAGRFSDRFIGMLRSERVMAMLYEGEDLKYWTSVAIDESIGRYRDSAGFGLAQIKRGWYLFDNIRNGKNSILLCYPLYRHYDVSNITMLDEGFNRDLDIPARASFHFGDNNEGGFRIGQEVFNESVHVHFENIPQLPIPTWIKGLFWVGVLCLIVFLFNVFDFLEHRYGFRYAWLFLLLSVIVIRTFSYLLGFPVYFDSLSWFGPDIYALPPFFPSLGDLLLNTVLGFVLVFSAYKGAMSVSREEKKFNWQQLNGAWVSVLFFTFMLGLTAVILTILQSLINDSSLNFDITNILNSGALTLAGLLIAAMLLVIHFLGVNILVIFIRKLKLDSKQLFLRFLPSVLIFVLVYWLLPGREYVLLIQSVSYLVAIYITYQIVMNQNFFQKTVAILFIVSVFASSLFYRAIHDRERVQRREFAERTYSPKDLNAEALFREIETKIEYDDFIKDYFRSPILQKDQLEKRVKQLYFTGYLSRFEMDLYDYDTLGNSFRERNDYSYNYLEAVYNQKTQSTLSNHFYFVNDPTLRFGYIAKYEVCTQTSTLGKLFILLKPKFIQDEKIFTELLSSQDEDETDTRNYSYAIYQDGELISQSGAYPYPLSYQFRTSVNDRFEQSEGFSHFIRGEENGIIVVVSKKQDSFLEPVTIFSFLFLAFSLVLILVAALNGLFLYLRAAIARLSGRKGEFAGFYSWMNRILPERNFRGIYFSTRIQIAMIGLVLSALLLTGYFTVQYIHFKYSQRQYERLDSKVKSILSSIENERRFEDMMQYNDELAAYLNQLAEFYNTDINLFNLNGELMASTQMRIFQSGVLLDRINPLAYGKISAESLSQHTQTERIGKLEYLATYVPVFDGSHDLIAYLNVPFFSNEKDLRQELSSFLESFINVYVFFFILAGIVAYLISQRITQPLTVIQARLAETRLGDRNERLEWRNEDEIGQLVEQYNSMVDQLEASAELLAKSERELAWKEMAKQIAHEIKNPLTPMKLSVQHLQRAWSNKNNNLEETFKRVTTVLIEQIDSLSVLATEFSSFAKMPVARIEEFELSACLQSVVELYFNSPDTDIHFSAEKEPLVVEADRNQVSRAFHNILKNAIQSIPENRQGKVEITLEREGVKAVIQVKDNGCGMDKEVAARIFTPSFSTKNSGMGMGLAITHQIIENAGGSIRFESVPDEGTLFRIELPLV